MVVSITRIQSHFNLEKNNNNNNITATNNNISIDTNQSHHQAV
jgi:hypothetical protein